MFKWSWLIVDFKYSPTNKPLVFQKIELHAHLLFNLNLVFKTTMRICTIVEWMWVSRLYKHSLSTKSNLSLNTCLLCMFSYWHPTVYHSNISVHIIVVYLSRQVVKTTNKEVCFGAWHVWAPIKKSSRRDLKWWKKLVASQFH